LIHLFSVRAEYGTYAKHFVAGGYVAITNPGLVRA